MLTLHFILTVIFNILPAWKYKHKHCSLFCSQINQETSKPKLAPLNEGGVSELLNKVNKHYIACTDRLIAKSKAVIITYTHCDLCWIFLQEITRLQEENNKLKARLRTLESQVQDSFIHFIYISVNLLTWRLTSRWDVFQAMSALDEKTKAERALKDLQKVQGEQQVLLHVWPEQSFIIIHIFVCDIFSLVFICCFCFLTVKLLLCCFWTIAVTVFLSADLDLTWYVSHGSKCGVCLSLWIGIGVHVASINVQYGHMPSIPSELICCLVFSLKLSAHSQEISSLEHTVASLKEDYERSLCTSAASQKDLQENLISAKHELLRVQEQLALAEKVHDCGLHPQLRLKCLENVFLLKFTSSEWFEASRAQLIELQLWSCLLVLLGHCVSPVWSYSTNTVVTKDGFDWQISWLLLVIRALVS